MFLNKWTVLCILVAVSLYYLRNILEDDLPPVVEGFFLPEFRSVAEVFRKQVESGKEKGGNFAAYYKGKLVVDLWGGYADRESHQRWKNETLATIFSTTKGIAAILAAKLVDQGVLDYKKLVSHYWPEFGFNGKENVTVEMLLSHQAGLAYLEKRLSIYDIEDNPSKLRSILAKERPKWPPGSGFAYHGITFGFYVDQLLSMADPKKRRVDQLFREEIAEPFDLDLYIGLPKCLVYRSARFELVSAAKYVLKLIATPSMWSRLWIFLRYPNGIAMKGTNVLKDAITNDPGRKCLPLSSFNGHGNARSIAKLYSIVANDGSDNGKQLMSQKTVDQLLTMVARGYNLDLNEYNVLGRGLIEQQNVKGDMIYGHPGYGGQMAFADTNNTVGMAYLTNDLSVYGIGNDPKFLNLQTEFYNVIDKQNS